MTYIKLTDHFDVVLWLRKDCIESVTETKLDRALGYPVEKTTVVWTTSKNQAFVRESVDDIMLTILGESRRDE